MPARHFKQGLTARVEPVAGIAFQLESIGKRLGRDDLRTRNDILRDETIPGFDAAFSDERDQRLIGAIESAQARDAPGNKVAIVYGAAHMHAVLNHLMAKHGYHVVGSDWLTVMDYDT